MTSELPSLREVMLAYERAWSADERTYARVVNQMWRRWREWTGDEAVAVHVGAQFTPLEYLHSELVLTSRTLLEATVHVVEFYNSRNILTHYTVDAQSDRCIIAVSYPRDLGLIQFDAELRLSVITHQTRWYTPETGAVQAVHFRAARPSHDQELIRVLGCPVLFNQPVDAVLIEAKAMEAPIWGSEWVRSRIARLIEAEGAQPDRLPTSLRELVAQTIRSCLEHGDTGIKCVAPHLGMSPRTLQRKLAEEGLHYFEVLDQTRMHLCTLMMMDPSLQLREMARQLGYSNESNFQHAFRRWFGTSPGRYRMLPRDGSSSVPVSRYPEPASAGVPLQEPAPLRTE